MLGLRIFIGAIFITNISADRIKITRDVEVGGGVLKRQTSCPEDWHSFQDHCYYIHNECATNWRNAFVKCFRQGSIPVIVETKEELNFLATLIDSSNQYWTAGRKNDAGDWVWIDIKGQGEPEISSEVWNPGEPNNFSGTESSVTIQWQRESDSWGLNDVDPSLPFPFICESYEERGFLNTGCDSLPCYNGGSCTADPDIKCTCPPGYAGTWCELDESEPWYEFEGHQYQFFNTCGYHRRMASRECRMYGGYLVAINSEEEMDFLESKMSELEFKNNHLYWWTGGKRIAGTDLWVWSEQSTVSEFEYTDWGPYEPNNYGGVENFVQLRWYRDYGWIWNDIRASKLAYFICERDN